MKLEQCGYCGRYFYGGSYATEEEVNEHFSDEDYEKPALGYCPNARQEHFEQNPEVSS